MPKLLMKIKFVNPFVGSKLLTEHLIKSNYIVIRHVSS